MQVIPWTYLQRIAGSSYSCELFKISDPAIRAKHQPYFPCVWILSKKFPAVFGLFLSDLSGQTIDKMASARDTGTLTKPKRHESENGRLKRPLM